MANQLSQEQLKRLARLGAQARLDELEAERRAILRAFPGLAASKPAAAAGGGSAAPVAAPAKKARKRKKMTAAQKKAVSDRMKNYWASKKQQG